MALHVDFAGNAPGLNLGFAVQRPGTALFFDFAGGVLDFVATPGTPTMALTNQANATFQNLYTATYGGPVLPAGVWTDGAYNVLVFNLDTGVLISDPIQVILHGGDDAPVFSSGSGGSDPWATPLPGSYAAGTAGYVLGNVGALVWAALTSALTLSGSIGRALSTFLGSPPPTALQIDAQLAGSHGSGAWNDTLPLDQGTISGATETSFTVVNLAGATGQHRGRRLRITFADGSHMITDPCTAHAVAGSSSTFTFAAGQNRVPDSGNGAAVLGP